jgi:hypothetical protein
MRREALGRVRLGLLTPQAYSVLGVCRMLHATLRRSRARFDSWRGRLGRLEA